MKKYQYLMTVFLLLSQQLFPQNSERLTYRDIRKEYEKMLNDDSRAMPSVQKYIKKAKKEKNQEHLIQGYRDGRQYSASFDEKLQYADSTISATMMYGNKDEISKAYLSKGILFYFNKKKFKPALDQYLKAYKYSKNSKDEFLKHKVLYHMGIVKNHLGYYQDAQSHFENCINFYEEQIKRRLHDNDLYSNKKAYYNSLHQLTVVNRYLKNFKTSDSLSALGYRLTEADRDFALEKSYFLKCMGISSFHKKDFISAKRSLEESLPGLIARNDFAWCSVVYYYLGKLHETQENPVLAIKNYQKIDSIFNKNDFILPEVTRSYHYLINHYNNSDVKKELYYTTQLLKADSLITKDFSYLSERIHKDYDRSSLMEEKTELERSGYYKTRFGVFLMIVLIIVIVLFSMRYRKDQIIKKKYLNLQKRLLDEKEMQKTIQVAEDSPKYRIKTELSPEVFEKIRKKIKKFEEDKGYNKLGLTQKSIAKDFGTNAYYLSVYIRENKEVNFTTYLSRLRINYITNLLNTNNQSLNFKIEALAEMCGIAARQNFSDLFYEYNGIRPADFIKNRKKELGLQ
ncbi:AraC family transcriptional regulator [Chryseobacterium sp. PBS4-4]|uniref:AraC family transcriptional regulator n=1 Tax=Chryseobacterium edaphi TaxID=2976532 RepID=A0ABT2W906_9FLAO|nr:AraC family transcriptional regulator [Chryseobacterium edaphi]MCU7618464.1 AraC family transcriptional regulator [Chryseobacterium edaphi]